MTQVNKKVTFIKLFLIFSDVLAAVIEVSRKTYFNNTKK